MNRNAMPSLSDAFKQLVADTSTALIANTAVNFGTGADKQPLPKNVYFMHGHIKEINAVLQSMSDAPATKNHKYPLVALFRDVRKEVEEQRNGLSIIAKPHLGIFTLTQKEYRAEDRKLKSFDAVLQPILDELIHQMGLSRAFGMPRVNELKIIKWDCYFYGSKLADKNVFNDYVDAIEIESMQVKLKNIC